MKMTAFSSKKTLTLAALLGLTLSGCSTFLPNENEEVVIAEAQDVASFSVLSTAALLDTSLVGMIATNQQTLSTGSLRPLEDSFGEVSEDQLELIHQYLGMFEALLAEDGPIQSTLLESDREGYEVKWVIETKGIDGETMSYTVYYNETEIIPEVSEEDDDDIVFDDEEDETVEEETEEVEEDLVLKLRSGSMQETGWRFRRKDDSGQGDQDRDRFMDSDDEEISSLLEGVLVVGSEETALEYQVTGVRMIEDDEIKTRFISSMDEDSFVQVIHQEEEGEAKFRYTIVQDRTIVHRSEVKVEQEDNEVKVDLRMMEGAVRGFYQFKKEVEDDATRIRIHYQNDDQQGVIFVTMTTNGETGEVEYEYQLVGRDGARRKQRDPFVPQTPVAPTPESAPSTQA